MGKWLPSVSLLVVTLASCGLSGCTVDSLDPEEVDPRDEPDASPIKHRDGGASEPDTGFEVPCCKEPGPPTPSVPARLANIVTADRPPPSISGGGLTITKAGDLAIATDPDRDALYLVNLSDQRIRTVRFTQGSEPGRVVLDESGGVHVSMRSSGLVVRVDLATAAVSAETAVCQLPRGLNYDAAKDELLVACASGELVVLDASTHAEHSRTFLDLDLRDVVVGADGQRFVSRYRSAELLALGADGKVASTTTPLVSKAQRFDSFVVDGGVDGIQMGGGSTRDVSLSATLAWRTVSAADGTQVMLHQQSQDDEVVISQAGGYGAGCQPITQAGITRYDAEGKPMHEPILLGGGALIVDIALSPDARWFALAKPGSYLRGERGTLEVLTTLASTDSSNNMGFSVPGGPTFLPDSPTTTGFLDGGVDFVDTNDGGVVFPTPCNTGTSDSDFDMQTTSVAFGADGKLYAFSREPAKLTVYDVTDLGGGAAALALDVEIALSSVSVSDTGHDLFHGDVGTGLACASCHGEALDDGHIWNFRDFGPRRTQNMRGGFLDTLPLHWEGDLSTFQTLVDEVMTRRMGGFAVEAKLANVLSGWMNKQPAISLKASDEAASARGKLLFESAELLCTTCHTGSTLTNNQTLDVGTGGLFQVPSLRGVGFHPPYMHDGCAVTLSERFDPACGGGDKHGHTSQLSPSQIDDLVAYLQTL